MVLGWIKSKIRKDKVDEYEKIKERIIGQSPLQTKTSEEQVPLIERFRKEPEREEILEPWERKPLVEPFRTEWKPFQARRTESAQQVSPRPLDRSFEEREFARREEPQAFRESYEERAPNFRRGLEIEGVDERNMEIASRSFAQSENINNRLRFIEEQLATIKAQNEVLIEKLRSIERRLGYV